MIIINANDETVRQTSMKIAPNFRSIFSRDLVCFVTLPRTLDQREKNGQQTKNRMRGRMMNGYWVFYPPVGYRYEKVAGHGKFLVPDEPVASTIRQALEGYATGRFETQSEMKRFLEVANIFPKNRKEEIHLSRVQELMDHIIYTGYISYEPWGLNLLPAHHQPIISLETWQAVQKRKASLAKAPARKDINEDFPLRGFVTCGDCDHPLTACWSK